MNGVTCPCCGARITVRGLDLCPLCRNPIPTVVQTELPPWNLRIYFSLRARIALTSATLLDRRRWAFGACILFIVSCLAAILWASANPSPKKISEIAGLKALDACRSAILASTAYGGADQPPYVKNDSSSKNEFLFSWPYGSFEFVNGFGAKVKMSATCAGSISPLEITDVTLNGRKII